MKRKLFSVILILSVLLGPLSGSRWVSQASAAGPICYVDDTSAGANNGSSWIDAFINLQSALGDPGCAEIRVAAGTYKPTGGILRNATFELKSGVTIQGGYPDGGGDTPYPKINLTTLSGDIGLLGMADNSYHVVTGSGVDDSAILDGFTISGGNASGAPPDFNGGGLYIDTGNPTLRNLVISGNQTTWQGGGIYLTNSSSTLTDVTISGNTGMIGAGLYQGGTGSLTMSRMAFENNHSNFTGGGAVLDGDASLTEVTFESNTADAAGAGLYLNGETVILNQVDFITNVVGPGTNGGNGGGLVIDVGSSPILNEVYINGNAALELAGNGGLGGGIYIYDGSPTFNNVIISGNDASNYGGGLYNELGNVEIRDSLFDYNWAGVDGGGAYILSGSVTIQDTTFDGNFISSNNGGGLWLGSAGSVNIRGSVFSGNQSQSAGGAIYSQGTTVMTDCLLEYNYAYDDGGGLALESLPLGSTFTNLTIQNNSTELTTFGDGGGMFIYASAPVFSNLLLKSNASVRGGGMMVAGMADPIISNATIYANTVVDSGSVLYNLNGHPKLSNTIVWGNSEAVSGPDIVTIAPIGNVTIINSILEDGYCTGTCNDTLYDDPQLADPANNDFRLLPTSPAVDAGTVTELQQDTPDLDGDLDTIELIPYDLLGRPRVVVGRVDIGALEAQIWNTNWTEAAHLALTEVSPDMHTAGVDRYVDREGQSRWYKFSVQPSSRVIVTLTGLSVNYDLALYQDIAQAYKGLESSQDLVHLNAEFAPDTFSPDTFSPDTFSPDTFSPDTFSPDTFSPDTFSPDTFSPDTFSPDTYSPDTFSPDTFSPDTFSPDTFSPDTFSPDTYSPDTFSPDTFSPDTFSPDTFSSAQSRSLITVSAHEGTLGEGIMVNTWTKSGDFYLRVRGRNGAFDANHPFHLQVTMLTGVCGLVSPLLPPSDTTIVDGDYATLILENPGMTEGSEAELALLQTNLAALAARTDGWLINVGADARVSAASLQAEANPACVYAKNLEAAAVKRLVTAFREVNPLENIVLVGNDLAIPFFRYTDNALLASELQYEPPVRDNTTSQASLKSGYILSQDGYGASIDLNVKAGELPIPDLPVGRLVETAADINSQLSAYLGDLDGIVTINNALVTGYDFLEDAANAVLAELQASLPETVDSLIMDSSLSPEDPSAWTANDLRLSLLGNPHDLVFLAGHFSANSALAADYATRMTASEVLASPTDFTNHLVYSAGCHSGYNIVNPHDVIGVTEEPDWAQAFSAKGATFIGGTGYQYGDTEFIEYSERLYLELTRQLRYGSEPVSIGQALVKAKQAYLAGTPVMRGLHEKSVLEATLFGLPMLQFDMPVHIPAPVDTSIVTSLSTFTQNPGHTLGLQYTDLSLSSSLTEQSLILDVLSQDGTPSQVTASYLVGLDGVVVNAAEPVFPLDMLNVTAPVADYVLRGVGWRGGSFTDLTNRLPLTGAATEDLRAPHPAFFSDYFYPVRTWNANYFDALRSGGGPTRLAWMPAQYRSSAPGSTTGILRRFDSMDFRLYYSANISSYPSSDPGWINTPALAGPPDVAHIASTIDEVAGTVTFEVKVTGDPAAGIQEVWLVYMYENGLASAWLPLDLTQDVSDSRVWRGTLSLGSNLAADLRFMVQAVNGVGLVTMMTNEGAGYRAGIDPSALPVGLEPATLFLEAPPASGAFGSFVEFSALLTIPDDLTGSAPLSDSLVVFSLGGQSKQALTDADGRAEVKFSLLAQPGQYTLTAAYAGNENFTAASDTSDFEILPGASALTLEPPSQTVTFSVWLEYVATLTSAGLPLVGKPVALTLEAGGATLWTNVAMTDYAGRARWSVPGQAVGIYTLTAWFGMPVSPILDLSNPYYEGSSALADLTVVNYAFSGFFPPVDNPPVYNKVKAGSAVPVKFSLDGDWGLNIFAVGYPSSAMTNCQMAYVDPLEQTVSAGSSNLSYDPLSDQYTYVWKTDKKWAGTCRSLVLKFIDGSEYRADFQFVK